MFQHIISTMLQASKNNKMKSLLLSLAGSQLIVGTIGLPILANSYGDTTPVLHRKRLLFEDEQIESKITNDIIKDVKNSVKLYHSSEIDTCLNHIVNVGVPKLLHSYKNELGDEKFQSLKKFVEKLEWEVSVVKNGRSSAVRSRTGKTLVSDFYVKEFLAIKEDAIKFFLCREVGRSLCRHENEMTTYLSIAIVDLFLAAFFAFSFLSRIAAKRFTLAGGAAVLLFDIYNSWRLEYEADCVGRVLYDLCGWHPEADPNSENALEWFKTHPNSYSLLLITVGAHQGRAIKDSAVQRAESTEGPEI